MKRRHEVLKHFIDAFQTTFRIIYVPPPFAKIDLKLFYITRKFDKHTLDNLKIPRKRSSKNIMMVTDDHQLEFY